MKKFRRIIYTLIAMSAHLQTRYMQNAGDSLRIARAFIGKALGAAGDPNPYHVVDNPSNIPPEADTDPVSAHFHFDPDVWWCTDGTWHFYDVTPLEACNLIRDEIAKLIDALNGSMPKEPVQANYIKIAVAELEKARIWIGYHIGELRDEAQQGSPPSNAAEVNQAESEQESQTESVPSKVADPGEPVPPVNNDASPPPSDEPVKKVRKKK